MKAILLALALFLPAAASAATTPSLLLNKPARGDTNYPEKLNLNWDTVDAAVLDKRVGGTIVGDLTVTSGSFVGDGSFLTGIPSALTLLHKDFTPQVNGVKTVFNLSTAPVAGTAQVYLDGLAQLETLDFTIAGTSVTMTTAPAANTYSFQVFFATSTGSGGGGGGGGGLNANAPILGIGTIGNPLRLDTSSVTLLGPTVDAAEIPFAATQVQFGILNVSTQSLQSQINSLASGVGFSATVYADTPIQGDGGIANHLRLDSSSVTLQGNSFNAANKLLQLSGSALIPNSLQDSSSVTLQGNSFNAANKLVRLDASSNAVVGGSVTATGFNGSGANLTSLYNIAFSSSGAAFSTASTSYVGFSGSTATLTGVVAGHRIRVCAGIAGDNATASAISSFQVIVETNIASQLCQIASSSGGAATPVRFCGNCVISVASAGGTVTASLMAKVSAGTFTKEATQPVWLIAEELK